MNLNTLIAAANSLYTESPAKYVNGEKDCILVYGDDDIANCLFDLLFSTSFLPGCQIHLVRVTSNGDAALDFFTRHNNEQEMRCFADNDLLDQETRKMPLRIHFYTYAEKEEWQSHSFAYAYAPKNIDLPDLPAKLYRFNEITLCEEENHIWSRADEKKYPVLRIARKAHTAYTAGWNDRYRDEDIDKEFYGSLVGETSNDYILRSNLRFAVSIPWKMKIAGAKDAEGMYNSLQDKSKKIDRHTVRDYLAWQEHRSWQAFMTLEGWRMPESAAMNGENSYIYKNGNDHRDKGKKLHPCLCDLKDDDWFATSPNRMSLLNKPHSKWSSYYERNIDCFSILDQISLRIHHQCKEIVLSPQYRKTMHDCFYTLENVLIKNISGSVDPHFQRLRLVENMFERLRNNEANSYHPFEQACRQFITDVSADTELSGTVSDIMTAYKTMLSQAQVAVERNKYCDYREIDSKILDWLPWIIGETDIDTIWKLYTGSTSFDNIVSSMILRPKKLYFVNSGKANDLSDAIEIYKTILSKRGLSDIEIYQISLSNFNREMSTYDEDVIAHHAIDVFNSGNMQNYIQSPPRMHIIFYDNGRLRDSANASGCAKYYPQKLAITVDEFLQMRGYKNLSIGEKNDVLGMENDYKTLWWLRQRITESWNGVIIPNLKRGEEAIRASVYAGTGQTAPRRFTSRIERDSLRKLVKNGCISVLFDLQRMGAISDLSINPDREISLNYYPNNDNHVEDGYSEPLNTLCDMLSSAKRDSDSLYVVDDVYVDHIGRIPIYDLKRPIFIDDAHAFERIDKLLVNQGLMNKVIVDGRNGLTYKSTAVRHGLKKGGFALEAYVYYTLFLSGKFDDVRSNVRMYMGEGDRDGRTLEKELDILVTLNGKMCIISCKDTAHPQSVNTDHILELFEQSETYGNANSILICSKYNELPSDLIKKGTSLHVEVIGNEELSLEQDSREKLIEKVLNVLS